MLIGLIDVDGHNFPNLPLMKLSAFHKQMGHSVKFYEPLSDKPEIVYMSKVFDFTQDYFYPIYSDNIVKGGTGYRLDGNLNAEIEDICPDYSLYGIKNTAYGFLTRGCPRQCEFCIVSKKEGCKAVKVSNLSQFWNGQKDINLLDPNLLACTDRNELLSQLAESNAWIDFTQGLDIRLMNEEIATLLMNCKIKMLHFAWDSEKDSHIIIEKLKEFKRLTNINMRKARVYVLTNFETEFSFDLERIYTLKALGYDPYVMIYDKYKAPRNVRLLQRWVNNKLIFRTVEKFEDYNPAMG